MHLHSMQHSNLYPIVTLIIIIRTLYKHWIAKFGLHEILVTDNGLEFINKEIITSCHQCNIKIKPITSHTPWTNGQFKGLDR